MSMLAQAKQGNQQTCLINSALKPGAVIAEKEAAKETANEAAKETANEAAKETVNRND